MELKNTNTNTENREPKAEEIARISISRTAEEAVTWIVDRVNNGFEGGKVNRSDVANWYLIRAQETLTDTEIKEIRSDHIDEFAFMDALMRKAKKTGKMPQELRAFMNKHLGLEDSSKKKKKLLQENIINGDVTIEHAA